MILQKIRTCLPEGIRTEEQDMLIGETCLALTEKERTEIENLNFENYQYNSPQRAEVSARVADAVYKAQLAGAATGAAVGALGGGARYLENHSLCAPNRLSRSCRRSSRRCNWLLCWRKAWTHAGCYRY